METCRCDIPLILPSSSSSVSDPASSRTSREELCRHSPAEGNLITLWKLVNPHSATISALTGNTPWMQVCATCFDLSVSLLRVLEMTVTLVPEIFLDWSRPSAELLLRRLAQVRLSYLEEARVS